MVTAAPTFPAFSSAAAVGKRIPLTAAPAFPAFAASTATVQINTATRHDLIAAKTFPPSTSTGAVYQTERVEASAAFPAFASALTVQQRMAARSELQASLAFPAFTAALTLGKRIELTASHRYLSGNDRHGHREPAHSRAAGADGNARIPRIQRLGNAGQAD